MNSEVSVLISATNRRLLHAQEKERACVLQLPFNSGVVVLVAAAVV